MGSCYNCGTQLSLQDKQTRCDKCNSVVFYHCWNCTHGFETADKDGNKIEECAVCGYFYCPKCKSCGQNCQKNVWAGKIKEIVPTINYAQTKKIVDLIESIKISMKRKECINCVPITYAKSRIKSLLARMDGFRVRNEADRIAFDKRIDEVTGNEIGTKLTIGKIRDAGSYGQEYRDAFNLLVCLGELKINKIDIKDKEGNKVGEYSEYERVNGKPCSYLSKENLITNECKKCKEKYPRGTKHCSKCVYEKGKNKGQSREIKERLNNWDTCQLCRGDFNGKSD